MRFRYSNFCCRHRWKLKTFGFQLKSPRKRTRILVFISSLRTHFNRALGFGWFCPVFLIELTENMCVEWHNKLLKINGPVPSGHTKNVCMHFLYVKRYSNIHRMRSSACFTNWIYDFIYVRFRFRFHQRKNVATGHSECLGGNCISFFCC